MTFNLEPVERRVVDNRVFIIGLDDLYRSSMREFEESRLLECARSVARELGATPASGPVEGYYADSSALTEYFQLMRALQEFPGEDASRVQHRPAFSLLHAIATSGIYGLPQGNELLPRCVDALSQALGDSACEQWSVARLVARAREVALKTGDFSLVALAARTGDPVALAATRESVVLYAAIELSDDDDAVEYDWQVDPELAAAANRFILTLNQFGAEHCRRPRPPPPAPTTRQRATPTWRAAASPLASTHDQASTITGPSRVNRWPIFMWRSSGTRSCGRRVATSPGRSSRTNGDPAAMKVS